MIGETAMKRTLLAAALAIALVAPASAQSVVGNASLGVSGSSARVALPAGSTSSPYLMVRPTSSGSNSEVFYQLGTSAVAAATTGPALPSNGICLNVGPNTHLAAITASGTAGLRLTRLTLCPPF
jgi:opacity protein-like surface antigen